MGKNRLNSGGMAEKVPDPDAGPELTDDEANGASQAPPQTFRESLRHSLKDAFGPTFWVFLIIATTSGIACWMLEGPDVFRHSLSGDLALMADVIPRIMAAVALAGLVQVLVPRAAVARALGEESGAKGIALAAGAGALTPGGPMTSFPLVNALHAAGSGRPALISYLTSWSVLGLQRMLSWEIPLLGADFTIIRSIASLPLPFVAAAMSRLAPPTPPPPAR
jgi:hypothetical protein